MLNIKNIFQQALEQLGSSSDTISQDLKSNKVIVQLVYLKSLSDKKKIKEFLIRPFFEIDDANKYEMYIQSLPDAQVEEDVQTILRKLLQGSAIIIVEEKLYVIDAKKELVTSIPEATVEKVIQGPQTALTESIGMNKCILRNRYHQASLRFEDSIVGRLSQTPISIIYDANLIDPKILEKLKNSLTTVKIDVLQAAGQLNKKLTKQKRTLFPTIIITERPDLIIFNLAQGKIIVLIDGTPFALIAPAVFYDFISSTEDIYQSYWISRFLILLRYIAILITLILPALYVGATAFNTEIFRVQLVLSIAGSRVGVPYPAFMEVFFMLIMMEFLTEASVRLPKAIGSTATTVGGLILGQAATEAALVSNIMIIIVAAVAISNFVIPINSMSFAIRVTKYIILTLTTIFGMVGLILGIMGLVVYLTHLESLGQPYFKLFLKDYIKENN